DSPAEPLLPLYQQQPGLRRSEFNTTSQVAIVGTNACPIESLDYEIIENEFFKHDWRSRGRGEILQYVLMKWILCFLVGVSVGLLGFFNNLAIENMAGIKFVITSNMMLARRYNVAFGVFAFSNLSLALAATLITALVAPEAAGSGIPEVKAYLNGVDAPSIFSFRTLIVKITGSILAVSSSLHIGKAGPMVHTGSCIAAIMGQGGSKKYGFNWKGLNSFKNDSDRRDLVTCGSAAGIAAAFRAPVGGLLFAFEEMASWWRSALLWRAFFTTTVVAIVLRALIDVCLRGECGLFGKGGLIMFDVTSENIIYRIWDVPLVILLAVFGGFLGSIFNFLLIKTLKIYQSVNKAGILYQILLACLISISTSCLLFGLPWTASCQACPSDTSEPCPTIGRSGNYKKFQCPPGYYNDLASLFFNTNDDAIRNLFSKGTDAAFQHSSMFIFFAACFFLSIFSYGIVAPVGLFMPLIVTGAAFGRLVGMYFGRSSTLNHGLFAVLGSASLLGGSMRSTVSLCVMILELTDNLLLLPLVMLALLVSKTVADLLDGNVYDLIMMLKGLPYLESRAEPYLSQLTVADVVQGPLRILQGVEKVSNVVHLLRTTKHNGFPVVDKSPSSSSPPTLFGLILRSHLVALLKRKAFSATPAFLSEFSSSDFAKTGPPPSPGHVDDDGVEEMELSTEEMDMFVDLHPFANTSPYTVVETMSLAKALTLFRELGLRHLLVIPTIPRGVPVVGILTRHDFMPEYIGTLHPWLVKRRWRRLRLHLHMFS
ncbi:hypothetical protein M569_00956, partial [Genlisea aurea]